MHQRIAREGFLQEETLLQEVFVASVVFEVARHVNDPQAGPEARGPRNLGIKTSGSSRWIGSSDRSAIARASVPSLAVSQILGFLDEVI